MTTEKKIRKIANTKIKDGEFLYYLCPIGPPNLPLKLNILKRNLINIHHTTGATFDIAVNSYITGKPNQNKLINMIKELKFIKKSYFHFKSGWLAEVFLDNPNNEKFSTYKYILFNMDDVEIINFPIDISVSLIKRYKPDCLSPLVIGATHNHMFPQGINILNRVEIFCLLMFGNKFKKFLSMFEKTNPSFWGVDMMMGYKEFYPLICGEFEVHHKLRNDRSRNKIKQVQGCAQVKRNTKNKYKDIWSVENAYQLIKERIFDLQEAKDLIYGVNRKDKIVKGETVNTLPAGFSNKKWNNLTHKQKYNHAIRWNFKAKNGKPLKEVQPTYDKNKNNFLPSHIKTKEQPKVQHFEIVNTLPPATTSKIWNSFSHKEKYEFAINNGFKTKSGQYLINVQPKYDPEAQNFLPL